MSIITGLKKIDLRKNKHVAPGTPEYQERLSLDPRIQALPREIRQKAAMISAHLLLFPGARVADMGTEDGLTTYAMALLNPRVQYIGIDIDEEAIKRARAEFKLPNLRYEVGDVTNPPFGEEHFDAIINSSILHEIYSATHYNQRKVSLTLEEQVKRLKPGGMLLIRDFVMPPAHEFALLELPDEPSHGDDPEDMSDADLLIQFSHTARPLDTAGCQGFFLEELPEKFPQTRLFRLPHKYACEFLLRKDYRDDWENELKKEYSFFTQREYRRELAALGARILYMSPYWNPWIVEKRFKNKFRLYTDEGRPMAPPPTNFFLVAQKMDQQESMLLSERRQSMDDPNYVEISSVRNERTGEILDMAKRPGRFFDVIPYRFAEDGRLILYTREGYPRPIVNAVPRHWKNLDGKGWSGHLMEPLSIDVTLLEGDGGEIDRIKDYLKERIGMEALPRGKTLEGPPHYPAPDFLEERIDSVFIEIAKPPNNVTPIEIKETGFSTAGRFREVDAQELLRAAQIGLFADCRLEYHTMFLMKELDIDPEPSWFAEELPIGKTPPEKVLSPEEIKEMLAEEGHVEFKPTRHSAGDLKSVRAVFVDEGYIEGGAAGLASKDMEFVLSEQKSGNIAVILPLTEDRNGEIMAGLEMKHMPAPARLGGQSGMITVPMLELPRDVSTVEEARRYVADYYKVKLEHVGRMGESFFINTSMSPTRVYPFAIATDAGRSSNPEWIYAPIKSLWQLHDFPWSDYAYIMFCRGMMMQGIDSAHGTQFEMPLVHTKDGIKAAPNYGLAPHRREASRARNAEKLKSSTAMPRTPAKPRTRGGSANKKTDGLDPKLADALGLSSDSEDGGKPRKKKRRGGGQTNRIGLPGGGSNTGEGSGSSAKRQQTADPNLDTLGGQSPDDGGGDDAPTRRKKRRGGGQTNRVGLPGGGSNTGEGSGSSAKRQDTADPHLATLSGQAPDDGGGDDAPTRRKKRRGGGQTNRVGLPGGGSNTGEGSGSSAKRQDTTDPHLATLSGQAPDDGGGDDAPTRRKKRRGGGQTNRVGLPGGGSNTGEGSGSSSSKRNDQPLPTSMTPLLPTDVTVQNSSMNIRQEVPELMADIVTRRPDGRVIVQTREGRVVTRPEDLLLQDLLKPKPK